MNGHLKQRPVQLAATDLRFIHLRENISPVYTKKLNLMKGRATGKPENVFILTIELLGFKGVAFL